MKNRPTETKLVDHDKVTRIWERKPIYPVRLYFSVFFWTLLHDNVTDDLSYSPLPADFSSVVGSVTLKRIVFSNKRAFEFLGFLRGCEGRPKSQKSPFPTKTNLYNRHQQYQYQYCNTAKANTNNNTSRWPRSILNTNTAT